MPFGVTSIQQSRFETHRTKLCGFVIAASESNDKPQANKTTIKKLDNPLVSLKRTLKKGITQSINQSVKTKAHRFLQNIQESNFEHSRLKLRVPKTKPAHQILSEINTPPNFTKFSLQVGHELDAKRTKRENTPPNVGYRNEDSCLL